MQTDLLRRTASVWDFLEPAMDPSYARTDHGVLKAASAAAYLFYPAGQILKQKNDGTNSFAKVGVSGYGGPPRICKYNMLVSDSGRYQLTKSQSWDSLRTIYDANSVEFFYQGFFKTQDLIGAGGTDEVQTETVTATGGTRKLSFMGYTTAAIAFDASAATIKAAMLAAMPILTTSDITVAGGNPYTYTFGGVFAGANVPIIGVDGALLTGGTSTMVETTPGAGLLTGVGRLIRGTSSSGVMELGAGTPS